MEYDSIKLSKTMSHALRHAPEQYGLTLDLDGWVQVEDLLNALRRKTPRWRSLQIEDLQHFMVASQKQRFEIHDHRIRAFYGHSTETRIERVSSVPPEVLYHGTAPQVVPLIHAEGLKPMKRQYVHLSADEGTAREVALRRTSRPVLLRVEALKAHQAGLSFYLGNDQVWLADAIPPEFLK